MPITLADAQRAPIDTDKCERVEQQIIDVLNSSDLSLRELIFVLAQTQIDIGGTLENVGEALDIDSMWRRYAVEPTLGNALMAAGSDMLTEWIKVKETPEDAP